MAVSDYNTNPDLNTSIAGINIAEGCPPSGINNAIRQLMADVKAQSESQTAPSMTGATSGAAGTAGLVPAPAAGKQAKPLRGDGTWADSLDCNITGSAAAATSSTRLATARTILTNLSSTATASFDGTASVTPGVTGTLPVTNGGTGATSAAAARTALGITLSDSVSSASSATFASSYAVKSAYDKAVSAASAGENNKQVYLVQDYIQEGASAATRYIPAPSGGTFLYMGLGKTSGYSMVRHGIAAGGSKLTRENFADISDVSSLNVFFWRIA